MEKGRDNVGAEPARAPAPGDGGEPDPAVGRSSGITNVERIDCASPTSDIFALRGGDATARLRAQVPSIAVRLRGHFQRLGEEDWLAVEDRVVAVLRSVEDGADELRVHHALFQAARDVDRERWAEEVRWDRAHLARWLAEAKRGVAALRGRTRECFLGMGLIEAVLAFHVETAAVDQILAIASSAPDERDAIRQRVSRAWRRVSGADDRTGPFARHAAQRFVMPELSFAAYRAAHDLVEVVLGLQRRYAMHKDEAGRLKAAERTRSGAWKGFVLALQGSSIEPIDVGAALCAQCAQLGIDDRVVPVCLHAQSWQDILCGACGPVTLACGPWRWFLEAHGFGPAVIDAFTTLEQSVVAVKEHERGAEAAWNDLLDAAERIEAFGAVKKAFWDLVEGP